MNLPVLAGIMIPFVGTALGAGCVFFLKNELNEKLMKALLGFASGVMIAASVWSLLIPAMDLSSHMGKLAFVPAALGFLLGMFFLLFLDGNVPHVHMDEQVEGKPSKLNKSTMMFLAVTMHNVPEGMAVGIVFASMMSGDTMITLASAAALAIGIAIQNFPEGAIISLPLKGQGYSKKQAFLFGAASGIVEPIASFVTILLSQFLTPFIPYLLSFSAGAMAYVVIEELIPESAQGQHSNIGAIGFALGFVLMMILDVALG